MSAKPETEKKNPTLLVEIAWEVCNQVGGIYTVIRSKVPEMTRQWQDDYLLIGPYEPTQVASDFEPEKTTSDSPVGRVLEKLNKKQEVAYYGRWLVSGRPKTLLLDFERIEDQADSIKYYYYERHGVEFHQNDPLVTKVLLFGELIGQALTELVKEMPKGYTVLAQFHEWMAGTAIADLKYRKVPIKIVFTTHATMLGRYLAMNNPDFYKHLPFFDWKKEAEKYWITPAATIERLCAKHAQVFSTVSQVTAEECEHLVGRKPDMILPNGLNFERFGVIHEVQNLHQRFKSKIHRFVRAHFFQSYSFDLDQTLYLFTSGRFEYSNKGYDMALEALGQLNQKLIEENSEVTVIMFVVTRQPTHFIDPSVLNSRAVMKEIYDNCNEIVDQVRERLFLHAASNQEDHRLPDLNQMVDDYWRLRYRRTIQSWKSDSQPSVVTHRLVDEENDLVMKKIRECQLLNAESDRVKIVYHPEFINTSNPLFGMDYGDFVRGCHLGIFPSFYEPWGYTPVECLASGVPTVTSDLSGFGRYAEEVEIGDKDHGLYVLPRANKTYKHSIKALTNFLFDFTKSTRKDRINMRNKCEDLAEQFDWGALYENYRRAYTKAKRRK